MTLFLQVANNLRNVVALDFNHTVFDRAATATSGLELLAQLGQGNGLQQHAFDDGHGLAAAPFGLTRDPHRAIALRCWCHFADALRLRLAAIGAHTPMLGGVNQAP